MPLQRGKTRKVINSNTKELIESYQQKGTISTSHPKTTSAAIKQAYAIANSEARKSK
jgi:hypothetical protein